MKRAIKAPDEKNAVNTQDKAWVTISQSVYLGNNETYRVESGYSQTLKTGDDPLEVMDRMMEEIQPMIEYHAEKVKRLRK